MYARVSYLVADIYQSINSKRNPSLGFMVNVTVNHAWFLIHRAACSCIQQILRGTHHVEIDKCLTLAA